MKSLLYHKTFHPFCDKYTQKIKRVFDQTWKDLRALVNPLWRDHEVSLVDLWRCVLDGSFSLDPLVRGLDPTLDFLQPGLRLDCSVGPTLYGINSILPWTH